MNCSHQGQNTKKRISVSCLMILVLGVIMGVITLVLAHQQMRWIIFSAVGFVCMAFILAYQDKRRLLTTVFILSLQVDVYLWLLHGHAGSAGLAIPLVVITGITLLLWYAVAGHLREFALAGSMRFPIYMLFATTVFSLIMTSEQFVGLTSLLFTLELYLMYWLVYNIVQTQEDFRRVLMLLMFTLAVQSVVYVIQSKMGITFDLTGQVWEEEHIPRPGGTVSTNPAGFTSFIMPALLIIGALAMTKGSYFPRLSAIVLFMLGTTAVGLSFTRAAWIGYALGVTTIVIIGIRRRSIKGATVVWIAIFAATAAVALVPSMMARVDSDYNAGAGQSTIEERLGLIRIAGSVIAENPLAGVGPGAYTFLYKSHVSDGFEGWVAGVHNEFILRAAETGVPGALAFIALLVFGFRVAIRLSRSEPSLISNSALGWVGALIALVWQMNWVPWTGWSYNAMLWIMLGLMDGAQRLVNQDDK